MKFEYPEQLIYNKIKHVLHTEKLSNSGINDKIELFKIDSPNSYQNKTVKICNVNNGNLVNTQFQIVLFIMTLQSVELLKGKYDNISLIIAQTSIFSINLILGINT